jgi:hypothetical protein
MVSLDSDVTFDQLIETAIQDALRSNVINIYRDTMRNIRNPSRLSNRYYNEPPHGGYLINEEHEYILPDRDDLSSALLLEIVTQFGSPGNDNLFRQERKNQIKSIGKYKKIKETTELAEESCPICLDSFTQGEYYRTLQCKHSFHKRCIDRWFKKDHSDCPMCRTKIIN